MDRCVARGCVVLPLLHFVECVCVRYRDVFGSSHLGSSVQHSGCVRAWILGPGPSRPLSALAAGCSRFAPRPRGKTVREEEAATVVIWGGYLELIWKRWYFPFVDSSVRGWFGGGLIRSADRFLRGQSVGFDPSDCGCRARPFNHLATVEVVSFVLTAVGVIRRTGRYGRLHTLVHLAVRCILSVHCIGWLSPFFGVAWKG